MGQDVVNAGGMAHAHGTAPATGDLEIWCHWGAKGIDFATPVTQGDFADLMEAALEGQGAFDALAGTLTPWYAFPTLTGAERATARATCRHGFAMLADLF